MRESERQIVVKERGREIYKLRERESDRERERVMEEEREREGWRKREVEKEREVMTFVYSLIDFWILTKNLFWGETKISIK